MYHHQASLRFKCTGCSKCCHGGAGDYVLATPQELEGIRQHLGLSKAWFRRRYISQLTATQQGIRLNDDGACPFLGSDGQCRVYDVRPTQCRSYPFWPENVASRAAWHREAKRCEGIGHGDIVPRKYIQAMLALDQPLQYTDD